ncbi:MAG: hypothetical protein RXN89_02100 [Vulcanisaeta sp.]|jgi:hypothetical protein|nr:hypothetical protein [Vulcanisaeta sp.]MCG2866292.1 hypothetical protein [Vulcanisaeta sp.]MCG2885230.1 hypothetical protein [Vulcanisaeta sp.]
MRKGLLIIGVSLIVLAAVIFFVGTYLSSGITSRVESLVTEAPHITTVGPGISIPITNVSGYTAIMVIYNDSLGRPLQVITPGPGALETNVVYGKYVIIYAPEVSSGELRLMNNYSEVVTVYYTYGTVNVSSLAPLALSVLIALGLGIAGVVLLILGALMKGR